MSIQIQLRKDTSSNWSTVNPVLAQGEPALEIDTLKEKIGDGITAWNDLAYRGGSLDESAVQAILEKWVKVTGTLADGDLKVVIGSHDASNEGLTMEIDEASNTVKMPGYKCFYDDSYGSYIVTVGDTEGIYGGYTWVLDDYIGSSVFNHGAVFEGSIKALEYMSIQDTQNRGNHVNLSADGNLPNGNATVNIRNAEGTMIVLNESDNVTGIPTPTSAGVLGEVRIIPPYRYECRQANTWVRSLVDTTW